MSKSTIAEEPPPPVSEEAEPGEEVNLVERLRKLRGQRAYEKLMALKGKIHINIDIDELRGRNR